MLVLGNEKEEILTLLEMRVIRLEKSKEEAKETQGVVESRLDKMKSIDDSPEVILGREQIDAQRLSEAIVVAEKLIDLVGDKPTSIVLSRPMPGIVAIVGISREKSPYYHRQGSSQAIIKSSKTLYDCNVNVATASKKTKPRKGLGLIVSPNTAKPRERQGATTDVKTTKPEKRPGVIVDVNAVRPESGVKAVKNRKRPGAIAKDKTVKPMVENEQVAYSMPRWRCPWAKKVLERREVNELSKALKTTESIREFGVKKSKTSKAKVKVEGSGEGIRDEDATPKVRVEQTKGLQIKITKVLQDYPMGGESSKVMDEPKIELSREDDEPKIEEALRLGSIIFVSAKLSGNQVQEGLSVSEEFTEQVRVENIASETIIREGLNEKPRQGVRKWGSQQAKALRSVQGDLVLIGQILAVEQNRSRPLIERVAPLVFALPHHSPTLVAWSLGKACLVTKKNHKCQEASKVFAYWLASAALQPDINKVCSFSSNMAETKPWFLLFAKAAVGICSQETAQKNAVDIPVRPLSLTRRLLSGPGSSPPRCISKCGDCTPCKPVHVSVPPGTPVTAEYYPEAWRCKCGNKLYMP
ncbi:EPIDERMAL PATTERNING FACTOR-like protein 4 [Hibiscus syriacus]|uniref:Epidermal patterning factor-like protein n=1 Tax=Hibiscus syriacus TaxID=106335 RepID=A0A6A3CE48_HIBSY|nr:EPIDERMAL PATTERNING FACTOR-like protein 4 [Hibiscus syriacus]